MNQITTPIAAPLTDAALDRLFRDARSANAWTDRPVADAEIRALYELTKLGPTSVNMQPARFLFLRTAEAKERLRPHLMPGNVEKTMTAPVVAIVGHDLEFFRRIPDLFPHFPQAADWFSGNEALARDNALRNGTLQGAYLMLAARALGLDVGPMSGFDAAGVDREFWAGTTVRTNFLVNIGHADRSAEFPRSPRLSFEEACGLL